MKGEEIEAPEPDNSLHLAALLISPCWGIDCRGEAVLASGRSGELVFLTTSGIGGFHGGSARMSGWFCSAAGRSFKAVVYLDAKVLDPRLFGVGCWRDLCVVGDGCREGWEF